MSAPRKGTVVEVIPDVGKWYYRIRWDDGSETVEPDWKLKAIRG